MVSDTPMVSVVIPCLNERAFIGPCLDSVVSNDYPLGSIEVLIMDGMSRDGTRAIIAEYSQRYPHIKMIDNPGANRARALNTGIREACGDIIIRLDAHATYEADYISKSVRYLEEHHADNVGGIRRTLPRDQTVLAKAIAYSVSSPFAAGNALYRTGSKTVRWVDTVFGGCFRKEIFARIGSFDETLIRGEDREFNIRLRRAGGKILLAPDIVCNYYVRGRLKEFVPWVFVSGLTPFYTSRLMKRPLLTWRNFPPMLCVIGLSLATILFPIFPVFGWLLLSIIAAYLLLALAFSIPIACQEKDLRSLIIMPFVFAIWHSVYGIGSLVGVFKKIDRQTEWASV